MLFLRPAGTAAVNRTGFSGDPNMWKDGAASRAEEAQTCPACMIGPGRWTIPRLRAIIGLTAFSPRGATPGAISVDKAGRCGLHAISPRSQPLPLQQPAPVSVSPSFGHSSPYAVPGPGLGRISTSVACHVRRNCKKSRQASLSFPLARVADWWIASASARLEPELEGDMCRGTMAVSR
jgi:hypothetical protein